MPRISTNLENLTLIELRTLWQQLWGRKVQKYIKPALLKKSILYKIEDNNKRGLTPRQKKRLAYLIRRYKSNSQKFDDHHSKYHFGTRFIRIYQGRKYEILVLEDGFKFNDQKYNLLSEIYSSISKENLGLLESSLELKNQ